MTMQRLYLVDLYDSHHNSRPALLVSSENKDTAEEYAEKYAEDFRMQVRGVTFVCETPEHVHLEI